jgi:transposase InsO family protein
MTAPRFAYSEIHPDETGDTCAGFLQRAAAFFASEGIPRIEEMMTNHHWSYTKSRTVAYVIATLGATHITIKAHCPWQNGKIERHNRTLQTEWAYHQVFTSNHKRVQALAPWLHYYNHLRRHHALVGLPPTSRPSATLMAEYT